MGSDSAVDDGSSRPRENNAWLLMLGATATIGAALAFGHVATDALRQQGIEFEVHRSKWQRDDARYRDGVFNEPTGATIQVVPRHGHAVGGMDSCRSLV